MAVAYGCREVLPQQRGMGGWQINGVLGLGQSL